MALFASNALRSIDDINQRLDDNEADLSADLSALEDNALRSIEDLNRRVDDIDEDLSDLEDDFDDVDNDYAVGSLDAMGPNDVGA